MKESLPESAVVPTSRAPQRVPHPAADASVLLNWAGRWTPGNCGRKKSQWALRGMAAWLPPHALKRTSDPPLRLSFLHRVHLKRLTFNYGVCLNKTYFFWSSCCVVTGSAASLEPWDTGLIPSMGQWVKDPTESQLQLRSDPWPRNSICCGGAKKRKQILFCLG